MAWKRLILFLFIFSVSAEASEFKINKITDLDAPWGSTFISDKELLITEKSGKIKLIELSAGNVSEVTHNLKILEDGQGGLLDILYKDNVVFVRFYYEGMTEVNGETSPYRTRVTMNWVKEGGNWVAKTQHYSPASYGGVHVPQASDFSDE